MTKAAQQVGVANMVNIAIADQGAALRVPSPMERRAWGRLLTWLGDEGAPLAALAGVRVWTSEGWVIAVPGDWIVLSVTGTFYVAAGPRRLHA